MAPTVAFIRLSHAYQYIFASEQGEVNKCIGGCLFVLCLFNGVVLTSKRTSRVPECYQMWPISNREGAAVSLVTLWFAIYSLSIK